jgi:hypothetical protein
MTARLGGRTIRTIITQLEVLSDDGSLVAMFDRGEDGSVLLRTRLPHESPWKSETPRFSITKNDALTLGHLLMSADAQYRRVVIDEIDSSDFTAPAPETPEPSGTTADCTQLDIERARAQNITEERELLRLSNIRDHSLDKHIGSAVEGCPSCDERVRPGHGDGSLPEDDLAHAEGEWVEPRIVNMKPDGSYAEI